MPEKAQEVKVHAPEEFSSGGRSVTGKLVTKPIARQQVKVRPRMAAAVGGAALGVLLVTWLAGSLLQFYPLRGLGLLLLSPILVFTAYTFLRDDELEPYRGRELYISLRSLRSDLRRPLGLVRVRQSCRQARGLVAVVLHGPRRFLCSAAWLPGFRSTWSLAAGSSTTLSIFW